MGDVFRMAKYIMALDAGTTSNRCILFDKNGHIVALSSKEFTQFFPHPGWVEHDPNEIWSTQLGVCVEAMQKIGAKPSDIVSIGITNQRETTVVWDALTGEPIYNAIVWQCRRTSKMCDEIKNTPLAKSIKSKTGLEVDAYFSLTKLKWILDNVKGAREKATKGQLRFGTVDTWLLYKLTGGKAHLTDYSNASRTMMFNINTLQWDKEILDAFDIPYSCLPEVRESSSLFGYTKKEFFGEEIMISGVAGDQHAALFGQNCFKRGEAKNTYGTGCFILMNTGDKKVESKNGLVTTIAWSLGGKVTYALEGSVFSAGSAVQWLRDELHLVDTSMDTEYYATRVKDTSGCYVVPAFTGLGAPYWDQYARGTIVGLTRGVNKYHLVRATLESLCYQTYDVLDAMHKDSNIDISMLRVDGGASGNNFIMQFQSDIINVPVIRPVCTESTALGAAYLAGLSSGFWTDLKEIEGLKKIDKVFNPTMTDEERENKIKGWKKAVKYSFSWAKE